MGISLDSIFHDSLERGRVKALEVKGRGVKKLMKDNFVEATGILIPTIPILSALETIVPKYPSPTNWSGWEYLNFPEMLPSDSMDARLKAAAGIYMFGAFLFSKGMDVSRATFNITDNKSSGASKKIHDSLYSFAVGVPVASALYFSNGDISSMQAAQGVFASIVGGLAFGWTAGLGIDYSRNLLQGVESSRVPKCISKLSSGIKYGIVAASFAAAVAGADVIYKFGNDADLKNPTKSEIKVNDLESKTLGSDVYDARDDFYLSMATK